MLFRVPNYSKENNKTSHLTHLIIINVEIIENSWMSHSPVLFDVVAFAAESLDEDSRSLKKIRQFREKSF